MFVAKILRSTYLRPEILLKIASTCLRTGKSIINGKANRNDSAAEIDKFALVTNMISE